MKAAGLANFTVAFVLAFGLACFGPGRAVASESATPLEAAVSAITQATLSVKVDKPAKPPAKQVRAFKKASADFSLDLFKKCVAAKGKRANVAIAPMSVMNALAMTANGAKGKTSRQMRDVIADGASISQINANLSWYNSRLANGEKAKLSNANAIWHDNSGSLQMREAFLSAVEKHYDAQVSAADFSDPATVDGINSWVAQKTNGMIGQIIDHLEKTDKVALVNALYFDAEWAIPYESSSVRTAAFRASNGEKRDVEMMYGTEYSYIKGKNAVGFIKPYAAGYSYVALLPKKGTSLKSFVKGLDGTTFRKLVSNSTATTVHTAMPKYSVSYSNDTMERQLAAMGMPRAFSSSANFSKMGTDKGGGLYLGTVAHKTKVDVDEQGTKAAAATAIIAKAGSAFAPDAKTVKLNRPFVYAIVDNATKLPVFLGTVNDIGE